MRRSLPLLVLLVLLPAAGAQEQVQPQSLIEPGTEEAIGEGLQYLVRSQGATGSWGGQFHPVADTSLACLAIMAHGVTYDSGAPELVAALRRGLDFITDEQHLVYTAFSGIFIHDGREQGRMHAHGYATHFLAEIYGTIPESRYPEVRANVRRILEGAVRLSVYSQTRAGGWGYNFYGEPESDYDEASVTVTQIQALQAAHMAGIRVETPGGTDGIGENVRERALRYIHRCARPDGFIYSLTMEDGDENRQSYELTVAAMATLNAANLFDPGDQAMRWGIDYIRMAQRAMRNPARAAKDYFYYGNLYAAQVMNQLGGSDWTVYYTQAAADLVSRQHPNGSWDADDRGFGNDYATACALLILQIPYNFLPTFDPINRIGE